MKKLLVIILSLVMMLTVIPMSVLAADATSGTCGDNLTWSFDVDTGVLIISGKGKMKDYSATEPAPWDEYKDQIKKIIVSEDVTTIGNDTFNGCKNLEEVSLPSALTKIGDSAFRDCSGLDEIEIPETVTSLGHYAFYGCSGLENVNVGDGVQTIGNYAFRKCSNLKSVTLPETLTKIGKGAFMECPSLFEAEYKGTDEQWAAVTVGEDNETLLDALKGIVLGDVNGDGKINSLDALYCLNHAVGKKVLEGKVFVAADVDKNGKINSMDALQILNYSVGKITYFPITKQEGLETYANALSKARDDVPAYALNVTSKGTAVEFSGSAISMVPTDDLEAMKQDMLKTQSNKVVFEKGTSDALNSLPSEYVITDISAYKDVTCKVIPDGNYQIDIKFKDDKNPTADSPIVKMLGLPDKQTYIKQLEEELEASGGDVDTTVELEALEYTNCSVSCVIDAETGEFISYKATVDTRSKIITSVLMLTLGTDVTTSTVNEYSDFAY